jgi:hypothetical protein
MFNLILIPLISIFSGCTNNLSGQRGISQDITESKRRGVFITEYTVYPNPYKINDSLQITVKQAWLESHWNYGEYNDETKVYPDGEYQLAVNTVEKDIENVDIYWTIGIDREKYMRISNNQSLISDFKTMPSDTIEFKVQQDYDLSKDGEKIIIGKFVLIKKK